MARPVVRTGRVDQETLELLRHVFGKATVAWDRLRLRGLVSLDVFRELWDGGSGRPELVEAVYRGWDGFARELIERHGKRSPKP